MSGKDTKVNITKKDTRLFFKTNVKNDKSTKEIIERTLNFVSGVISSSLGPYGANTIIQDRGMHHVVSKDGYTILNRIMIYEAAPRTLLDLIRNISRNLVKTVGDGSSSAIVAAKELYYELNRYKNEYNLNNTELFEALEFAKTIITDKLKEIAIPINTMDEIENIATISFNNNKVMGSMIRLIFEEITTKGNIHVELSKNENTYFEIGKGFEVKRGYIDKAFANVASKQCELLDPYIFMCNGTLDQSDANIIISLLNNCIVNKLSMGQAMNPIVFIAKAYDPFVMEMLAGTKRQYPHYPILAIDMATGTTKSLDKFNDLAYALGCKVYDKLNYEVIKELSMTALENYIGKAAKVVSSETITRFIIDDEDETYSSRVAGRINEIEENIKKAYAVQDYINRDDDIYELNLRKYFLAGKMAKLYIGGKTELEKENAQFLAEDAVLACKSAINHGYVIGGNLAIPFVISDLLKKENPKARLLEGISRAFLAVYRRIVHNLDRTQKDEAMIDEIVITSLADRKIKNLVTQEWESVTETTVINSVETDIEILNAALSIITLLVNSNQFITTEY